MSKPAIPLDAELAKIFGNNTRIFRAMRELFKQAGDLSPTAIEEALIAAGNAGTAANQALDTIERITQAIELIALMPRDIDTISDDDLTPPHADIVNPDNLTPPNVDEKTLDDLSPPPNADLDVYIINGLTSAELKQLQNINSVTILNAQWVFLGEFNQALTITSNVTFATMTIKTAFPVLTLHDTTTTLTTNDVIGGIDVFSSDGSGAGTGVVGSLKHRSNSNGSQTFWEVRALTGAANDALIATFFGSNLSLVVEGRIISNSTTESTSPTTGSGQFDGGLGVVKNIHGGGDLTVDAGGETFLNLPTVSTGSSGSLWSDSGTVKVVP